MEINESLMNENADILVVDDTKENLMLLSSMLKDCGFLSRPVPNGRLALLAATQKNPDLVLLDINMPEMDGYEVCRQFKQEPSLSDVPVIFISALTQTNEKLKAFEAGGVDYITKPFQFEEVKARVDTHLKLRRLQQNLKGQVVKQVKEISDSQMSLIFGMAKLAEVRDNETGRHLDRIQVLCKMLAEELKRRPEYSGEVDDAYTNRIFNASPLHDIGKVGIPDSILLKPGKLTEDEFEIMKTHATIGAAALEEVYQRFRKNEFVKMGIEIARWHHEKWDGSGYPDGLKGDEIPLSARIMAVVDVYDAVRSKRVYKPAISHEETRDIILKSSGSHFDPVLVEVFSGMQDRINRIWQELQE